MLFALLPVFTYVTKGAIKSLIGSYFPWYFGDGSYTVMSVSLLTAVDKFASVGKFYGFYRLPPF